jgi:hypothetical protein
MTLPQRAIACRGWRWLHPSIALSRLGGEYVVLNDASGPWKDGIARTELYVYELAGDDNGPRWRNADEFVPDLECPATLGCLLALVREAWASRGFVSVRHPVAASLGEPWDVVVYNAGGDLVIRFGGATEAEALVNALENAP